MRRDFRAHFHKERSEKILLNDRMNFFLMNEKNLRSKKWLEPKIFPRDYAPPKSPGLINIKILPNKIGLVGKV